MKKSFRQSLRKLILVLFSLFIILFAFRIIYGYQTHDNLDNTPSYADLLNNSTFDLRKNYASKEYKLDQSGGVQSAIRVDQKYEKIADVKTMSSDFEKEEKLVRHSIEKNNALIQFEQKSGNEGYRSLNLIIGVPPENFDTLYNQLTKIGSVQSKQITKNDKTNEYKELNAKKASLEKIRASLIELKSKGGKIEEYIDLENRILDIEQQLQELGVNLGNFDEENEFCTVKLILSEGKVAEISVLHRIKVALEWTISVYIKLILIFIFIAVFSYLALLTVEKAKIIERLIKN